MPENLEELRPKQPFSGKLIEAVKLYNRFRSPEARAEILKIEGSKTYVKVEGSFCWTCGVNDWIEDFVYTLEDVGVEAELVDIIEPKDPNSSWRIGVVKVKRWKDTSSRTRAGTSKKLVHRFYREYSMVSFQLTS